MDEELQQIIAEMEVKRAVLKISKEYPGFLNRQDEVKHVIEQNNLRGSPEDVLRFACGVVFGLPDAGDDVVNDWSGEL